MTLRHVIPILALALTGCSSSDNTGLVCTAEARYGLVVEVRDADTQAGLAAFARGVATEGAYADSLRASSAVALIGVVERAGTYAISIRTTGYLAYDTTGVRVTKDACHVIPQTLKVSLQKLRN